MHGLRTQFFFLFGLLHLSGVWLGVDLEHVSETHMFKRDLFTSSDIMNYYALKSQQK